MMGYNRFIISNKPNLHSFYYNYALGNIPTHLHLLIWKMPWSIIDQRGCSSLLCLTFVARALSPLKQTPRRKNKGDKMRLPPSSWSSFRQLWLYPLIPVTVYQRRLGRNQFLWRGCGSVLCSGWVANCERAHHREKTWECLKLLFLSLQGLAFDL